MQWTCLSDQEAVAQSACLRVLEAARCAIAARGRFSIVLAGGSTPEHTYQLLARSESDWRHWHVYFGDERCLKPLHPERNSVMAARSLTGRVPIPKNQVHPIPVELGPEQGAQRYAQELNGRLPFDLVLLGIGEDGHTASLFPGQQPPPEDALVLAVRNAPKPPPERVSLSPRALSDCRQLLFLVTGENKRSAVTRWRNGAELPAAGIKSLDGCEILIDRSAWGET